MQYSCNFCGDIDENEVQYKCSECGGNSVIRGAQGNQCTECQGKTSVIAICPTCGSEEIEQ